MKHSTSIQLKLLIAGVCSFFILVSCKTGSSGVPGKDIISDDNPAGESMIRNTSVDGTDKKAGHTNK